MILISVLGDFHSSILPLLYNFKNELTKHVLVYDDSKKDVQNAFGIKKGIKKFCKNNNYTFLQLNYKLDEDSLSALSKCAKYIANLTDNQEDIYINTTDGYSTLTTILNFKLFKNGVNFIAYDMYDNQYNILNTAGLVTKNIKYNLNIVDHFLLKGYKVQKTDIKEFAQSNKKNIIKIFENMADKYDDFLKLDSNMFPTINDLKKEYEPLRLVFLNMNRNFANLSIKNAFFTGSMFECYVYLLLKDMSYDDIEIGIEVFRKYKNSDIKNEFDILIMKENHLHMIECKFRNYLKLDELIYKYIALSNIIDEDGKMAIVTKKPSLYDNEIDLHRDKALNYKRGRLNNIYLYGNVHNDKTKFQKEIKSLFKI